MYTRQQRDIQAGQIQSHRPWCQPRVNRALLYQSYAVRTWASTLGSLKRTPISVLGSRCRKGQSSPLFGLEPVKADEDPLN